MNSFFWHDYETWGANPAVDKPCQFAGIRTDEQLNIVGDPLVQYCRPSVDCLPQPDACLVTQLTPQQVRQEGVPEPLFFARIHQALSQPGTCGVGYNSLRFDDEVTRYGLYRNFYDPYEREWKDGNSRWDIIDMVRLTYALRPESMQWAYHDDGSPAFKLEWLTQANGLDHGQAHDALSDVYATIALAKLIQRHQPALYDYAYQLRHKRNVMALIDVAQRKPLLHISARFPSRQGCAALVAPLLQHPSHRNSIICYDLSFDPAPLLQLSAEVIAERLYTPRDTLRAQGLAPIPLKTIHINQSPMIATPKLLDATAAARLAIDKSACERHWQQLRHGALQQKLRQVYQSSAFTPKTDPEQQLYDGFVAEGDRALLAAIRASAPADLAHFADKLQDPRLKTLLFRYRARHYPHTLNDEEQQQWQRWCYSRLTDKAFGASMLLEEYFARLDQLATEQTSGAANDTLLSALLAYGDTLLALGV